VADDQEIRSGRWAGVGRVFAEEEDVPEPTFNEGKTQLRKVNGARLRTCKQRGDEGH